MKHLLPIVLLLGLLLVAGAALAQSGDGYDLSWNTFDGGGGTSAGGDYIVSGAAGQADAGALLLMLLWGCVCARIGIHVSQGHRHLLANLLANLLGCTLLLGVYQLVLLLTGH